MEHNKPITDERVEPTATPNGIVTTMFTDIVGSTKLKGMVSGETSARRDAAYRTDIKGPHDALVLLCVQDAGGYVINSTGDGYCATFVDAEEAILCALKIQKELRTHPIPTPLGPLQVRIGLHTGMFKATNGGYAAATLDKTARVQGKAEGGQVFISRETHALVAGKLQGIAFERAGTFEMKGLDAEGLYRVTLITTPPPGLASLSPPLHHALSQPLFYSDGKHNSDGEQNMDQEPRKRFPFLWPAAALALVLLGGLGYFVFTKSLSPAQADLPPGSVWMGSFRFLPPIQNYSGSASLTVIQRSGNQFAGTYATEDDKYEWRVNGTLQDSHLHWGFVQVLKNPSHDNSIGKAYVEGTLTGSQFTGIYHENSTTNDTAQITLQLQK